MRLWVKDYWENETLKFDTELEFAKWWIKQFENWDTDKKFSQLNVTGKDYGWAYPRKNSFFYEFLPKRYQVLDDAGRSIDIRLWPKSIWEEALPKPTSYYYETSGRKYRVRKCHAPFGLRRALMEHSKRRYHTQDVVEAEEAELESPCIRPRVVLSGWDINDYYNEQGEYRDKSWKTRSRCRKQWQRHMNVHGRNGQAKRQELPEDWHTIEPEEDVWLDECSDLFMQPGILC